jgi:hypothetical protein
MLSFGIGAAAPLVLLGSLSRPRMLRVRGRLLSSGKCGNSRTAWTMPLLSFPALFGMAPDVQEPVMVVPIGRLSHIEYIR